MSRYGEQLKMNAILLVGITTLIPRIFSLDDYNLQSQRYDYIDVAKETAGSRSKGQTTRIFTTGDELDERFWLKYLGEDFRHAVHLQVDGHSNVIPLVQAKPPPTLPTLKYNRKAHKRSRFARQPAQQQNDKQLPVEDLVEHSDNENQYPTEKPETFNVYLTTTTTTPTATPTTILKSANKKQYSGRKQQQNFNNENPTKLNKDNLLLCNKNHKPKFVKVKRRRMHKTINEPIVVHLPETDDLVYPIHEEEHVPVPPLIYQQKAELYPKNKPNRQFFMPNNQLFVEQNPNPNMDFEYQPLQLNTQNFHSQDSSGYTTHFHQTHLTPARITRRPQHKKLQEQQYILSPKQYTTHKQQSNQLYP